jgi:hypothetical protein
VWGTCVEYNPKYLYDSSSLAQVDNIKAVESPVLLYKRVFERLLDDYCLTKANAMAVVGRPNMCGVPVWSILQNTSVIEAVWHKMTA